ncbi:MAG: hypothetical protein AVDCRST_MAG59-828, partial [uncultured Thermomicrobiales bacterium]
CTPLPIACATIPTCPPPSSATTRWRPPSPSPDSVLVSSPPIRSTRREDCSCGTQGCPNAGKHPRTMHGLRR